MFDFKEYITSIGFELYAHQEKFLQENPKAYLLGYDTGLGKTLASILWARQNNLSSVLVIVTKTIKKDWAEELERHAPDLKVILVTKEEFRDKFDINTPAEGFICDEAHYFSSTTSKMYKKLKKWIKKHNPEYRLLLSATPVLSKGSMNVYALATLLGQQILLLKWREVFQFKKETYTSRGVIWPWAEKTDPETEQRLVDYINKIGVMVGNEQGYAADGVEMPEQKQINHSFDYTQELNDAIIEKIDGEVEPIVIWTHKHRLEQSLKTEKVQDLIGQYKKVILVCRYTDDVEMYKEIYPEAFVIIGKTKNRKEILDELKTAEESLVIVNSAISEGWQHPHCEAIIFASLDFSFKNFHQMKGRALRRNLASETDIHVLTVKGGSDANVYRSIMDKKDFSIKMYLKGQAKLS